MILACRLNFYFWNIERCSSAVIYLSVPIIISNKDWRNKIDVTSRYTALETIKVVEIKPRDNNVYVPKRVVNSPEIMGRNFMKLSSHHAFVILMHRGHVTKIIDILVFAAGHSFSFMIDFSLRIYCIVCQNITLCKPISLLTFQCFPRWRWSESAMHLWYQAEIFKVPWKINYLFLSQTYSSIDSGHDWSVENSANNSADFFLQYCLL